MITGQNIFMIPGLVFALCAALLCGCTKDNVSGDSSSSGDEPKITLEGIDPSSPEALEGFELVTERGEGGFDIAVVATDAVEALDSAFFAVTYDETAYHAFGIETPAPTDAAETLALAIEAQPGRIESGIVKTRLSESQMVRSGDVVMSFKLLPGTARSVLNVADTSMARARNLELDQDAESNWVLSWDYTNPGDSNQDGQVGITDLTPIGQHFKEHVENDWDHPLRHVDGDSNGEINASDITPIGQHYSSEVWAYQIEMSEDGTSGFITVGQLILGEQQVPPGETVRFSYTFGGQYVEDAWYRVVPLDDSLQFGTPSESISENGRRIEGVEVAAGQPVTVTVFAQDLEHSIGQLNSVRVVFPDSYHYVTGSANPGATGGFTSTPDGIWGTFVTDLLFPPDAFFVTQNAGDGWKAVEFNVSVISGTSAGAPVGFGDLINFKLEGDGSEPLTLFMEEQTADTVWRTFYTDSTQEPRFFGNRIGLRVQ